WLWRSAAIRAPRMVASNDGAASKERVGVRESIHLSGRGSGAVGVGVGVGVGVSACVVVGVSVGACVSRGVAALSVLLSSPSKVESSAGGVLRARGFSLPLAQPAHLQTVHMFYACLQY